MKVSVIITSYNYGDYLERAIRSCLHQRFVENSYEIIVVNDASTDHTSQILTRFNNHSVVRVIENETNMGVAYSANRGFLSAFGQYVVRVDADDFVSELFIFFLQSYLEYNHSEIGVACDYVRVDKYENYLQRCYANDEPISCGIMYRRDALVAAGLYDIDLRHCEEFELRNRLGNEYRIGHLRMPFYKYRMHGANKTNSVEYQKTRAKYDESPNFAK